MEFMGFVPSLLGQYTKAKRDYEENPTADNLETMLSLKLKLQNFLLADSLNADIDLTN